MTLSATLFPHVDDHFDPNTLRMSVQGSGQPVLLVNGIIQQHEAWGPMVDQLKERYRVISFDFPNQGYTPELPAFNTHEQFCRYTLRLLEHLELDPREVSVVGLSLGAELARDLHFRGVPFKKLVLCGLSYPGQETYWQQFFKAQRLTVEEGGLSGFMRFFAFNILSPVFLQANRKAVDFLQFKAQELFGPRPAALKALMNVPHTSPLVKAIPRQSFTCPTYLLNGRRDNMVPWDQARDYARTAGAEFFDLDAGHLFTMEKPDESLALIMRLLQA